MIQIIIVIVILGILYKLGLFKFVFQLLKLIYLLIKAIFYPINFLIRFIVGLVSKTNEKLEEKFGK